MLKTIFLTLPPVEASLNHSHRMGQVPASPKTLRAWSSPEAWSWRPLHSSLKERGWEECFQQQLHGATRKCPSPTAWHGHGAQDSWRQRWQTGCQSWERRDHGSCSQTLQTDCATTWVQHLLQQQQCTLTRWWREQWWSAAWISRDGTLAHLDDIARGRLACILVTSQICIREGDKWLLVPSEKIRCTNSTNGPL